MTKQTVNGLVYLAGPIAEYVKHLPPSGRHHTFAAQWRSLAEQLLTALGWTTMNPVGAFGVPSKNVTDQDALKSLQAINNEAINQCTCILVDATHPKANSPGTQGEIELALSCHIPVFVLISDANGGEDMDDEDLKMPSYMLWNKPAWVNTEHFIVRSVWKAAETMTGWRLEIMEDQKAWEEERDEATV